jgi:serine/threonine-protein kinase TTK/MPS1
MELGSSDLNVFFKNEIKKYGCVREPTRVHYWVKMLKALHAIHTEGVIHSDIKPANFIVVGCEVKLIDFNISNTIISDRTSITMATDCGTLQYMAPETLLSDGTKKMINQKVDIWAMGIILYFMTYGKLPFYHIKNQYKLYHSICDPQQKEVNYGALSDPNLIQCIKVGYLFFNKLLRILPKYRDLFLPRLHL